MAQEELLVVLGAKDNATTAVKKLNNELKFLQKEYKITNSASKDHENSLDGLKNKLTYLQRSYDLTNAKLDQYKRKQLEVQALIDKKQSELAKLNSAEEKNAVAIEKTEKQLEKYKSQLHNVNNSISITEAELKSFETQIRQTDVALKTKGLEEYNQKVEAISKGLLDASTKIKNVGQNISNVGNALTFGVTMPIVGAGVAMLKLASDAEETTNKVDATFGDNAKTITKWAKTTLDNYGIAGASALEYAATVGDILKGIGFDDSQLVGLSETIISMSGDIASFKNSKPEEVFSAITAALTGEREQLTLVA